MPIYDYLCTACNHRADILHRISEPGPRFCPSCGAEGTLRKQFAAPTIHFKGSGWAKKDRGASHVTRAAASSSGSGDGKGAGADGSAKAGPEVASDGSSSGSSSSGGARSEGSSSEGSGSSGTAAGGSDGSRGSGTSGASGPTSARED